jgi:hypothetical protein
MAYRELFIGVTEVQKMVWDPLPVPGTRFRGVFAGSSPSEEPFKI